VQKLVGHKSARGELVESMSTHISAPFDGAPRYAKALRGGEQGERMGHVNLNILYEVAIKMILYPLTLRLSKGVVHGSTGSPRTV